MNFKYIEFLNKDGLCYKLVNKNNNNKNDKLIFNSPNDNWNNNENDDWSFYIHKNANLPN